MTTSFPTLEAVPPSKPVEGWKVLGPVRDGSRRVYAAHLKESEARLIADAVNERHALRVELDRLEGALESVCLQLWKELRNRGADFPEYKNVAEARDLMRESTALKGGE